MLSDELVAELMKFRAEREWEQFHTTKNLAIAISVEAAELLEQFQWTTGEGTTALSTEQQSRLEDEIADVAMLLVYLANDLGVDVEDAVKAKLARNEARYPVEKSRGSAVKYDRL